MKSIVIKDISSGLMFVYKPKYPAQRSFFEQKRNERIQAALTELKHTGNIGIYLLNGNKLRLISVHNM